jgi:TonB family protein
MEEHSTHRNNGECLSYDTIMGFINGSLSQHEKDMVRIHMKKCDFCSDAVEGVKAMNDPKYISQITKKLNSRIDKKVKEKKIKSANKTVKMNAWRILSVAASIALLIGLYIFFNNTQKQQIIAENKPGLLGKRVPVESVEKDEQNKQRKEVVEESEPASMPEANSEGNETEGSTEHPPPQPSTTVEEDIVVADDEVDIDMQAQENTGANEELSETSTENEEYASGENNNEGNKRMASAELATVEQPKKEKSKPDELKTNAVGRTFKTRAAQPANTMPIFKNGSHTAFKNYVLKEINIPERLAGEKGEVVVAFTVTKKGKIKDIQILQSYTSSIDAQVEEIIKNSEKYWQNAIENGQPADKKLKYDLVIESN